MDLNPLCASGRYADQVSKMGETMSRSSIWAVFGCLILASAIGAYKVGRSLEAQSNKFAGLASYSQFWLANQPALASSDDFKVEQAL